MSLVKTMSIVQQQLMFIIIVPYAVVKRDRHKLHYSVMHQHVVPWFCFLDFLL